MSKKNTATVTGANETEPATETAAPATSEPEGMTSLFRKNTLKAKDFQIVQGMIAFLGATRVTRAQMMPEAASRSRKYPPYFVFKNLAVHVKGTNLYDLSRLKLAKGETALDPKDISRVSLKAPKKAAKGGKKESKARKEAPVVVEPVVEVSEPISVDAQDSEDIRATNYTV